MQLLVHKKYSVLFQCSVAAFHCWPTR